MNQLPSPKVVVVTGASAGVGRATVRKFARQGAQIGLLARGRDGLEAAKREVESLGGQGLVLPIDVANAGDVDTAAGAVERRFGPIDAWINNAMVSVFAPLREIRADEFRRVTEVTYLGYVHGTMAALKRMRERNRGVIVQVGSALAYRGIPLQSAYCGAKHAIQGFTESVRCELLHEGSNIHLTSVHLPAINTPQFTWVRSRLPRKPQPIPPIFQPEVAAEAIYWAARHRRREISVGLMNTLVILGNKIAPGLADWYLARTGYEGQMTDCPDSPHRPDNLWQALPGDHGAHGEFDDKSHARSLQLQAAKHRGLVTLAGLGLAGIAMWGLRQAATAQDDGWAA